MQKKKGVIRRSWDWLLSLPAIILLVGSFFGGIIVWGGFNTAMEMTNTMEFCISCHEMHDNVYQEYKETPHFKNASGVQANSSLMRSMGLPIK